VNGDFEPDSDLKFDSDLTGLRTGFYYVTDTVDRQCGSFRTLLSMQKAAEGQLCSPVGRESGAVY